MAFDSAKAAAMRGDSEPDPEDPNEAAEGENEGPSEEELMAAKRLGAALGISLTPEKQRAVCAAIKDLGGY